jgi:hypothetical protein
MTDFMLEKKLKDENSDLHQRMRDSIAVMPVMMESYLTRFPTFTDHSL